MTLFQHETRQKSEESRRIYATFEVIRTAIDFAAAILFLVGSIMFFSEALQTPAIWCFVIGSLFFAAKPTLKLMRELRMLRQGKIDALTERDRD